MFFIVFPDFQNTNYNINEITNTKGRKTVQNIYPLTIFYNHFLTMEIIAVERKQITAEGHVERHDNIELTQGTDILRCTNK